MNAAEKMIVKLLKASNGNMAEVSRKLDIAYPTLVANLHRMGIDHTKYKPKPKPKKKEVVIVRKAAPVDGEAPQMTKILGGKGHITSTRDSLGRPYVYITLGYNKYIYLGEEDARIVHDWLDRHLKTC